MIKKAMYLLILSVIFLASQSVLVAEAEEMKPGSPGYKEKKKPGAMMGPKMIRSEKAKNYQDLVNHGKRLWNSAKLGTSGLTCMTCHEDHEKLNLDKKETSIWPHYVKMSDDILTLDQMINFCMINPMAAKPIDANSVKMTAIAAYYTEYVKEYKHGKK